MDKYYFNDNKDKNGKHEVHTSECSFLPSSANRTLIGFCDNCHEAIRKAKNSNPSKNFDGCFYCSNSCHTG